MHNLRPETVVRSAKLTAQAIGKDKGTDNAYDFLVQSAHALLHEFDDGAGLGVEVIMCGCLGSWCRLGSSVVLFGVDLIGSAVGTIDECSRGGVGEGDGSFRG